MNNLQDNQNTPSAGAWDDKLTKDYVSQWGELPLHKKIPELCHLLPSDIALDIGCGSGAAVRAIAKKLKTGQVTGIDPTPKMLEIANELTVKEGLVQTVTFVIAGAEKIPVASESCDLVLAVNTLHHWLDVKSGLNEVLRILKPSGRFVSIDDLWEESTEYSQKLAENKEDSSCKYELKTVNGIMQLLTDACFTNISNYKLREPDAIASVITGYKALNSTQY